MHLSLFWAVTKTAVIMVMRGDDGVPVVRKICQSSKNNDADQLFRGHYVGIAGNQGVILYDPKPAGRTRLRDCCDIPEAKWGDRTSALVGLFLNREDAIACLFASNLETNDSRFREQSAETLAAIGTMHPVFVISKLHYKNGTIAANAA